MGYRFKKITAEYNKQIFKNVLLLDEEGIAEYSKIRNKAYVIEKAKEVVNMWKKEYENMSFYYVLEHCTRDVCQELKAIIIQILATGWMFDYKHHDKETVTIFMYKAEYGENIVLDNMRESVSKGKHLFLNVRQGYTAVDPKEYKILSIDTIESHLLNTQFVYKCGKPKAEDLPIIYYGKKIYTLAGVQGESATHESIMEYYDLPSEKCYRLTYNRSNIDACFAGIKGLLPSFVYNFNNLNDLKNLKKSDLDVIEKYTNTL